MRVDFSTLMVLLAVAASAAGQSLGDVARKEKKRREENERSGASVRVITDADVRKAPPLVHRPGTEPDDDGNAAAGLPTLTPGARAPNFALPDRTGRTYTLASFSGRPVLIDFWATWCGPCRQTMPEVESLHRRYAGELQVVGINIEGNSADVLAYLDQGGYTFRVLFDSGNWESVVASDYGVNSIPHTFLLDRSGRVLYKGHPSGLTEETIQAALAANHRAD